jgi:glycosyltransferase involved in cell wall biosynthesis
MTLDLVFPVLPPAFDGIGDHTAHLARALGEQKHEVRVWTAQPEATPIPGVQIEHAFDSSPRGGVHAIVPRIAASPPDAIVVQYNPFSYGRWGLNLSLPAALREVRRQCPDTRIAVMVHEPFVPVESWRFAVFTTWQRWQLWQLGGTADVLFFSISPWVQRFQSWFPGTPSLHLPVGSNIPVVPTDRAATRARLGLSAKTVVCGIFGSAHESRDLSLTKEALRSLHATIPDLRVLYVGTSGPALRSHLGELPLIDAGALPAAEVSHHLSAMDLYLSPFRDGVSTRRGSFMAGLQHGIPTVTTTGPDTDPELRAAAGDAFRAGPHGDPGAFSGLVHRLATDGDERRRLGEAGASFYEQKYDWPHVGTRLVHPLQHPDDPGRAAPLSPPSAPVRPPS